jgi:stress response protein SCP2
MINLTKGQGIDLTKKGSTLKRVNVALGWAEAKRGIFGFLKDDIDCDASVACLNKKGKLLGTDFVVYYGNKTIDGIHHSGDDLVGGGNKDNETISIEFDEISSKVDRIPIFMNIYKASDRGQNLGCLNRAYIRVYNADTNEELCRYDLDNDKKAKDQGFIAGELSRTDEGWKFTAIGESVTRASRVDDIISRWY